MSKLDTRDRVKPVSSSGRGPNEKLVGIPGSRYELGTPALVLDLDAMEANIESSAEHSKRFQYALRPVAKVHKSIEIARRQIEAGGLGVCCSTLAESEVMVDAGIPGVMLFTPVVSKDKLDRLARLNAEADGLIVVVDDVLHVSQFAHAARCSGRPLQVLVDVEVGGGRTGVPAEEHVLELARAAAEREELKFAGLQAYVGAHQKIIDYETRKARSVELLQPLLRAVERLQEEGLPPLVVSGGGTGTHDFDPELGVFTEIQLGTYVLMDVAYSDVVLRHNDPHPFRPALFVRTTVVSTAKPGLVITDAGTKELDGMFGPFKPQIIRGAPEGATYSLVGDDMGRIEFAAAGDCLAVGDIVDVMPPRCYQTLCLYSHYHVVRGDVLVDIWPIDARASW